MEITDKIKINLLISSTLALEFYQFNNRLLGFALIPLYFHPPAPETALPHPVANLASGLLYGGWSLPYLAADDFF